MRGPTCKPLGKKEKEKGTSLISWSALHITSCLVRFRVTARVPRLLPSSCAAAGHQLSLDSCSSCASAYHAHRNDFFLKRYIAMNYRVHSLVGAHPPGRTVTSQLIAACTFGLA